MAGPGEPKSGGRQAGTPNKATATIRSAILGALDAVGGQAYLEEVARTDPKAFCTLLGKVLPTQLSGPDDADGNPGAVQLRTFNIVPVYPADREGDA